MNRTAGGFQDIAPRRALGIHLFPFAHRNGNVHQSVIQSNNDARAGNPQYPVPLHSAARWCYGQLNRISLKVVDL